MVINNDNNLLFISNEMRHGTKINYHITQHTHRDDEENQYNINVIEIIINMIHK